LIEIAKSDQQIEKRRRRIYELLSRAQAMGKAAQAVERGRLSGPDDGARIELRVSHT
jgi:hypothetical protein